MPRTTVSHSEVRSYLRTDGTRVVMEYVSVGRTHVLVMSVNGITWKRCHLARPYKPSAKAVAKRWQREDPLAPEMTA